VFILINLFCDIMSGHVHRCPRVSGTDGASIIGSDSAELAKLLDQRIRKGVGFSRRPRRVYETHIYVDYTRENRRTREMDRRF